MKIGIDISQIVYDTGVSWYTYNLVKNLLEVDTKDEFILFAGVLKRKGDLRLKVSDFSGNFQTKVLPIPPVAADFIWNKLHVLPIEGFIGKVDVFHSSDWTQPGSKAFKVTTIHDLSPLIFPETAAKDGLRDVAKTHSSRFGWVKKEVDRVIAVSESTKKDVVKYLGIPEDKITVIYEAPDAVYTKRTEAEVDKVKVKYNISGRYLLCVGSGERKNHDRIFKAYETLGRKDLAMVVASHAQPNLPKSVIHVQSPTREELACLYSGASALIYSSLYEGFGLPILEAFACGCPVVTSNISSMPEVAGEAAVLVDPKSSDSIREGISKSLEDSQLLIRRGEERVKDFSWEKVAGETLKVYRRETV
jgi:glycosyltransferase involved in cell wall biosynthesis